MIYFKLFFIIRTIFSFKRKINWGILEWRGIFVMNLYSIFLFLQCREKYDQIRLKKIASQTSIQKTINPCYWILYHILNDMLKAIIKLTSQNIQIYVMIFLKLSNCLPSYTRTYPPDDMSLLSNIQFHWCNIDVYGGRVVWIK